jgi:hypothetical protein
LKFRVIDFISQHDESSDQQSPADCHFGFGMAASNQDPLVNSSQFLIPAHGYLSGFDQ